MSNRNTTVHKHAAHRFRRTLLRLMAHLFLAALALVFMFPFYWLFISAFKAKEQIFTLPPLFVPHPWLFANFVKVFQETHIVSAFFNSPP